MPATKNPTSGRERDYARYGRRRTGAPMLPMGPGEVASYAQRIYRSRLGPMLSAALLPTFSIVLAIRYVLLILFPSLVATQAPTDQAKQVGEFATAIGVGLIVAIPLGVLSVAGYLAAAYREATVWMDVAAPSVGMGEPTLSESRAMFGRATKALARALLAALSVLFVGIALLIAAGATSIVLGEGSPVAGGIVVVAGIAVLIGVLYALVRIPRSLTVVPVALYEQLGAKEAVRRTKDLSAPRPGSVPAASTESSVFGALLLTLLLLGGIISISHGIELQENVASVFTTPMPRLIVSEIVAGLPLFLTILVIAPYVATLVTVGYFERRVSAEGFDIELMSARLEAVQR